MLRGEERPEVCKSCAEVFHFDLGVDLSGFEIAVAHQVRDVGEGTPAIRRWAPKE
jgi:hypothetical protein